MRSALCLWAVALLVLGLCAPATGFAYCRMRTVESRATGCPERCQTQGMPLYWPKRELSYVLNERGFPGLTDPMLRSILANAFGAWEQVRCEGGVPVGLVIEQRPSTTQLGVGPREAEPNDNVIVHLADSDWDDDPRAFAITKIWYDTNTGHILGADMQFNGRMDPFGVCPDGGCKEIGITDLRNVVTHEAGHFLGLAHSDEPESTMWCDAAPGDVDKRDLDLDDVAGLCACYGPNAFPDPDAPTPSASRRASACSALPLHAPSAPGGSAGLLLAGLLGLLLARRRRTAQ